MSIIDLTDHFLIAMPQLGDPCFAQTVTYICEHDAQGALGIIINRPIEMTLDKLFSQMQIEPTTEYRQLEPVYFGGPVRVDRGFVLHKPLGNWQSTLAIRDDLGLTTSKDILQAISQNQGPEQILISLGYASWTPGQLEHELLQNTWLTVPSNLDIMFTAPPQDRLQKALYILGVNLNQLSAEMGHA